MDPFYIDPEILADALDDIRDDFQETLSDEDVAFMKASGDPSLEELYGDDGLSF